jgi:outer membrane lipoprotein carrier protein
VGRTGLLVACGLLFLALPAARLTPPAIAGAPDMGVVVDKLQATCAKTQDLSAQFQQTVSYRSLNIVREGGGSFMVKRPGKVRWEYNRPEPRLFVTDGKTLWDYSPADKQVRVLEAGEAFSSRVPLSFLAGDCDLRREFTVSAVEHAATRGSTDLMILDLKPLHPEAGITRILLEVNLQTYIVGKTTAFDAAGNTTVIALTNVTLNTGLSDRQFQFTPPADVSVVNPAKR